MHSLKTFYLISSLLRLNNATLPIISILAGYYIANGQNVSLLIATIVIFVLLHSFVTIWNDVEDEDVDALNGLQRIRYLRANGYFHLIVGLFILLGISIICTSFFLNSEILTLCALYVCVGWVYNSLPIQASRRPLMSMFIMWVAYGVLPFALGAAIGELSPLVIAIGLSWSLTRLSLSILKDYKDAKGDALSEKRTFLLVYGRSKVAQMSILLAIISYALLIIALYFVLPIGYIYLIALGVTFLLYERVKLLAAKTYQLLNSIFHRCLKYQLLFDGLIVVWLITG